MDYRLPDGEDTFEFDTVEEAFNFKLADCRTVEEVMEKWVALPTYQFDGDTIFHYKE